jgi:hypothetical protein
MYAGFTFDAGFQADYLLIVRNGFSPGARFDIDYARGRRRASETT